MTDTQLSQLEQKTGTTKEEFITALNLLYMLSDIQDSYLFFIERVMKDAGYYGFADKQLIKDAITRTKKVVKLVDRVTSYEYAVEFGDKCTELRELIDNWAKKD